MSAQVIPGAHGHTSMTWSGQSPGSGNVKTSYPRRSQTAHRPRRMPASSSKISARRRIAPPFCTPVGPGGSSSTAAPGPPYPVPPEPIQPLGGDESATGRMPPQGPPRTTTGIVQYDETPYNRRDKETHGLGARESLLHSSGASRPADLALPTPARISRRQVSPIRRNGCTAKPPPRAAKAAGHNISCLIPLSRLLLNGRAIVPNRRATAGAGKV